jgi:hypothetical protein
MSFKSMKKNRAAAIDKLVSAAENASGSKQSFQDDRLWKPTVDKAGNGYAVIRFLPQGEEDSLPWVRYWDHAFKGPTGQWYIEKSLTTLEQPDPASEMNSQLWNTDPGDGSHKKIVRDRKRKLNYVSNILVISDPSNPDNEGKVFLFKYGKKIFDKVMDVMQPEFEDEKPMNPFDFWEGADFKLKIRKVDGYRNYDKSEFVAPAELFGGDEDKLEGVYNSLYRLSEFTDPTKYKSYDQLAARLQLVLGESVGNSSNVGESAPEPAERSTGGRSGPVINDSSDDDDDDAMSYFSKLAEED